MNLLTNIYSKLKPRQFEPFVVIRLLLPILVLQLGGCFVPSLQQRIQLADDIARQSRLQATVISTQQFKFKVYQRATEQTHTLLILYIEGDGRAWTPRQRISSNPTPVNPVALKLAARDSAPALAYIARPCQYVSLASESRCSFSTWTDARYSNDVVNAFMDVISQLKAQYGSQHIGLVGYSGGGTIAALVAARRQDVSWLVTVAGNLNPDLWTKIHRVGPLTKSLNPIDDRQRLQKLQQLHFVGADDEVMPVAVANSYQAKLGNDHRSKVVVVKNQDHGCCWQNIWPQLMCSNIGVNTASC